MEISRREPPVFDDREITKEPLSLEELREIHRKSGLSIKSLFNTSGGVYRELEMKVNVNPSASC